jgi:hypothetical protein
MKHLTFPLQKAWPFATQYCPAKDVERIKAMRITWPLSYTSSVRRGLIFGLLKDKNLLDRFVDRFWPVGSTRAGLREIARCERIAERYGEYHRGK